MFSISWAEDRLQLTSNLDLKSLTTTFLVVVFGSVANTISECCFARAPERRHCKPSKLKLYCYVCYCSEAMRYLCTA